jgi:hypothetical protein
MLRLTLLVALIVSTVAFAPVMPIKSVQRTSFKIDMAQDNMDKPAVKNLVRDVDEPVKWVDPAMTANTSFNILDLGWGMIFILGPLFLFANDAFHFL